MKNILVIGGAGYIGSHTVKMLAEKGYNPIVFDNLSKGHLQAIKDYPFEKLVKFSIGNHNILFTGLLKQLGIGKKTVATSFAHIFFQYF